MPTPIAVFPANDNLLNTEQAAAFLGMSTAFLERDRCRPMPQIPFARFSARAIRYRREDLQAFLTAKMVGVVGAQPCL